MTPAGSAAHPAADAAAYRTKDEVEQYRAPDHPPDLLDADLQTDNILTTGLERVDPIRL